MVFSKATQKLNTLDLSAKSSRTIKEDQRNQTKQSLQEGVQ